MRLFDAHNHLQDPRLGDDPERIIAACRTAGIVKMVVNGSCEEDWPQVQHLARRFPEVIPSYGYHPWYLHERTADWFAHWHRLLLDSPHSVVGEIGLDRWKPGLPYEPQEEVFLLQLRAAAELNRPATIHCLQAWGRLFDLLRSNARPAAGFLLHSYGGPVEMVAPLAKLGAYFSFPGYFLHLRKERQRAAFRAVPRDRLLIETDAPDQPLPHLTPGAPSAWSNPTHVPIWSLPTPPGQTSSPLPPLQHPANLLAVYHGAASTLQWDLDDLAQQVETNFKRLFATALSNPDSVK